VDARTLLPVENPIVTDAAFDMKGGKRAFSAAARLSFDNGNSRHSKRPGRATQATLRQGGYEAKVLFAGSRQTSQTW
jgi:hypothetical protein